MFTRTRDDLVADIKTHIEFDPSFISDADLEGWINKEGALLHAELVKVRSALYRDKIVPHTVTVGPGTHSVAVGEENFTVPQTQNVLPSDHFHTRFVRYIKSDGTYGHVEFMQSKRWRERHHTQETVDWDLPGTKVYFREAQDWFRMEPPPQKDHTVELYYAVSTPFDSADSSNQNHAIGSTGKVKLPIDWTDYIVFGCVVRAADKMETDSRPWQRQQQRILQSILTTLEASRNEIETDIADEWCPEGLPEDRWY